MAALDDLAGRVLQLGDRLAQPAAETVLQAARMEAFSALATGVLNAGLCYGFYRFMLWNAKKVAKQGVFDSWEIGVGLSALAMGITGLIAAWSFLDPWVWATISHPELWVAKRLLKL